MRPLTFPYPYPAGGVLVSHIILALSLVKADSPIVVTLLGMVTEVRDSQSPKAYLSIVVTLLGMVTEIREVQRMKAKAPIVVTLLGMVTEVRELQP